MKKFRFRLETPLQWRQRQEDLQKEKISKCQEKIRRIDAKIQGYQDERDKCFESMRINRSGTLNLDSLRIQGAYLPVLQDRIEEAKANKLVAEKALVQAQQEMMVILQAKKILEKLKAKHYSQYRKEIDDYEQKLNDELASVAFNRKEREHRI